MVKITFHEGVTKISYKGNLALNRKATTACIVDPKICEP